MYLRLPAEVRMVVAVGDLYRWDAADTGLGCGDEGRVKGCTGGTLKAALNAERLGDRPGGDGGRGNCGR